MRGTLFWTGRTDRQTAKQASRTTRLEPEDPMFFCFSQSINGSLEKAITTNKAHDEVNFFLLLPISPPLMSLAPPPFSFLFLKFLKTFFAPGDTRVYGLRTERDFLAIPSKVEHAREGASGREWNLEKEWRSRWGGFLVILWGSAFYFYFLGRFDFEFDSASTRWNAETDSSDGTGFELRHGRSQKDRHLDDLMNWESSGYLVMNGTISLLYGL
ncbi:hypothetical protein BKA64DRAFT_634482 [Cadophora sp. MPI-SDFR-AT-0126]|nr:hypothetical protein BKA64DRAFT_634482 [Leotiomycetes sp. MPI-SDFR-AT-0126]